MTIQIKLSTGKVIELTPEEYKELTGEENFVIQKKEINYIPVYPYYPEVTYPGTIPGIGYLPEITCKHYNNNGEAIGGTYKCTNNNCATK